MMERRRRKKEDKKEAMAHKANMKVTEYQTKEQTKMKVRSTVLSVLFFLGGGGGNMQWLKKGWGT